MAWNHKLTTTQRGYGYAWRKIAKRILRRDDYLCQVCRINPAIQVDHKVSKADGGTDEDSNLQAICNSCHDVKTAKDKGYSVSYGCGSDGLPIDPDHHWNK